MSDKEGLSPEEKLVAEIRDCYKEAKKHSADWRTEAVENYDFVAGRQWDSEDTAQLEKEERPIVTFNRMGPYFDAISGSEMNNRQEIKYLPRTVDDQKKNEILNAAVKWVTGQTNAEDEESDAFYDVLVSGMGWIETRMDYEDDPDGRIVMERVDPLEMYWDPTSKKKNLTDAKWLSRVKWLSKEEIEDKWPELEIGASTTPWGDETEIKAQPHNASLAFLYRESSRDGFDEKSGKYRVLQHLYYEKADVYRVADQASRRIVTLSPEKYEVAKRLFEAQGIPLKATKQKKKVYKYCFVVGDKIAEEGELKCGFNIKAITGKRDQNTNLWYGLARVMKDPQRWANKFLAQIMHIVNSNAKGGLLAEEGAFKDPRTALDNWTDPTAIVWLKNGGLTKVKEREQANYPVGLDKLLAFAVSSIPDVTGVNVEFLGNADREQAGVLEVERKKAVYVILAGFFNSLRQYRKEQGRLLAHFIKEYLNDGRIIRIATPAGEMPVPLQLDDDVISYDVIVDESPSSPNLKEEVWQTLGQLVPQLIKAGVKIPGSIMRFTPLPEDVAREIGAAMDGQLPPDVQKQIQEGQARIQQLELDNNNLKQSHEIKAAQVQSKHELGKEQNQIAAEQNMLAAAQVAEDLKAEIVKIQAETEARMRELMAEMDQKAKEHADKMQIELLKAMLDDARRQQEAEMKSQERKEIAKDKADKEAKASKEASKPSQPVVIDVASAVAEPVAKVLEKVEKSVSKIEQAADSIGKNQEKKRKRKITTPRGETYLAEDV